MYVRYQRSENKIRESTVQVANNRAKQKKQKTNKTKQKTKNKNKQKQQKMQAYSEGGGNFDELKMFP